jgi:N utilization substance protein A
MASDLLMIVRQIMDQTELPQETFIEAIEAALYSAAKRRHGSTQGVSIKIDPELGEIKCYVPKKVVEIMHSFAKEIPIEEAIKLKPDAQLDEMIEVELDTKEFGRIEAQTARQILVQKIKEAERQQIYEEYKDREGEVVSGHVQRMERGSFILELERTEGLLPYSEMPHPHNYQRGDMLKCLILEVQESAKGPQVILSRTHPTLVARLFEMEVPEIYDGLVRLMAIERDPGDRAKVAVTTTDGDIDAVGTCVGVKGSRVQTVVRELDGEKIDLLEWSEDPKVFISHALQPAAVLRVTTDEADNAEVIVPDDQLSLAIGRRGQNARLAARLTGWKVDIKSESEAGTQFKEEIVDELFGTEPGGASETSAQGAKMDLVDLEGVGPKTATALKDSAFSTVELIAKASLGELSSVPGIGAKTAEKIQGAASQMLDSSET